MRMTVREREVGRVVGHGMALGLDAHAHVGQREIGVGGLGHGDALYRVALLTVRGSVQSIFQSHVCVQWIVLRTELFLLHTVIQRCAYMGFLWEEFAQLQVGCHAVILVIIGRSLGHTLFQSAKTFTHIASLEIDRSEIRHLYIQVTLCRPTAFVVVFQQTKLIDPHLTRLHFARFVAHTNHHGLHLAQRRVTHHADFVVGFVGIVVRINPIIRCLSLRFIFVSLPLEIGE